MTNSEHDEDCERSLEELFTTLRPAELERLIDDPIREAASAFARSDHACQFGIELLELVGRFIAHLSVHAAPLRVHAIGTRARSEGLHLIESAYRNEFGRGFYAAVLDLTDGTFDAVELIFDEITSAVIQQTRDRYVDSVLARAIEPLDWESRVRLTEHILAHLDSPLFSPPIAIAPGSFAHELGQLIQLYISLRAAPFGIVAETRNVTPPQVSSRIRR